MLTLSHAARRLGALALVALGACADEPTQPAARPTPGARPSHQTAPSSLSGPVLVTVKGRAEGLLTGDAGAEVDLPIHRTGYLEFEYRYAMPDPNVAGTHTFPVDYGYVVRSYSEGGTHLGTFTAAAGQATATAYDDDPNFEDLGGLATTDHYTATFASAFNGVPFRISAELDPDVRTGWRLDIIPGDPAKYVALDAGWYWKVLWIETFEPGDPTTRRHVSGFALRALSTTVEPLDADGDGVANPNDACPNTPAGATVDQHGCVPAQADDDQDGVPNTSDACPNTASGSTVDPNGCAPAQLDADGDGVPNGKDRCAATPKGAAVDADGCTPVQSIDVKVPCAGPAAGGTWGSHGAYVAAVTAYLDQLFKSGAITDTQRGALLSGRAGSTCGSTSGGG